MGASAPSLQEGQTGSCVAEQLTKAKERRSGALTLWVYTKIQINSSITQEGADRKSQKYFIQEHTCAQRNTRVHNNPEEDVRLLRRQRSRFQPRTPGLASRLLVSLQTCVRRSCSNVKSKEKKVFLSPNQTKKRVENDARRRKTKGTTHRDANVRGKKEQKGLKSDKI